MPTREEWIRLSDLCSYNPHRGIKGVTDSLNYPIVRAGSVGFVDKSMSLWMFGGDGGRGVGFYNDLWKYHIDTTCLPDWCPGGCKAISVNIIQNGQELSSFGVSSYQWYLNGSKINGATSAVYIANEPGYYTLEITDSNGCTAMSTPVLISGIDEIGAEAVSIYPNPAKKSITILTSVPTATIKIANLLGQILFSEKISGGKNEIDFSHLPGGMYFVNNRKFVKE